MNTNSMRWVDSRLGVPACFALSLWRRLTDSKEGGGTPCPERILIVKLAEQGATVVAYSALERAIEMVGRDNVFAMVFAENRFIMDELGLIPAENIITIPTTGPVRFAIGSLRAIRFARRHEVDAAVDFEFFARVSAALTFLSGARIRVGFHSFSREASYRGDLMTHRLAFNPRLHASETFLRLVEALTVPATSLPALDLPVCSAVAPPILEFSATEQDRVVDLFDSILPDLRAHRLVLLNANASDLIALRKWPDDRYIALATTLLERHADVAVVFTGSPDEACHAADLVAAVGSPRCVSAAGLTTMRQLLVLYSIAHVMVTNDSGPAQYAALAPIDVVTLFGPESPDVFGSLSPRSHPLWASLPCSPCVNAFNDRRSPCTDNICMQHITVDEVAHVVDELLAAA